MRNLKLGFMVLLAVGGTGDAVVAADSPDVVVHDAWVRLPAGSRTDTAAYMVIENRSASVRSVVAASSPDVTRIEMHEMKMSHDGMSGMARGADHAGGSMMTMLPVAKIDIPAKGRATLAPSGLHLMLFGLKSKPSAGSKVNIQLKLGDGSTVQVAASVRAPQ